jgi:hypothetical protein
LDFYLGWDDQLSKTLFEKWQKWLKQLHIIKDVKVPRCFSKYLQLAQDVQFHVFCEASQQTYTAVIYLRIEAENITVALVVSKARVSPLRAVTIPKMELMAAVLGSRLLTAMKIRVIGRIHESKFLSDETKQPIILDGRHEVVECMVHHYHVKHMHYGVKTLLNFLKQKFTITKMRSVAKKVKSGPKAPQMGDG